jgi:Fur family transcriptional regulator, zinc uptake regulator
MSSRPPLELTRNQQEILSCLRSAAEPLGGYAILDRVRSGGIAYPNSVYRALHCLVRLGLVHRIESLDSFVACTHPHGGHQTGFLICEGCGKVVELPLLSAQQLLLESVFRGEIKVERIVSLEFAGRCRACLSGAEGRRSLSKSNLTAGQKSADFPRRTAGNSTNRSRRGRNICVPRGG